MYTLNKLRNAQSRPGIMFAVIATLALYAGDAASSAPPAPLQIAAASYVVPADAELAATDNSQAIAQAPLLAAAEEPLPAGPATADAVPYVEGSQLNRPEDTVMPTRWVGQVPIVPEATTYSMLIAGLLGLAGLVAWKRHSI